MDVWLRWDGQGPMKSRPAASDSAMACRCSFVERVVVAMLEVIVREGRGDIYIAQEWHCLIVGMRTLVPFTSL